MTALTKGMPSIYRAIVESSPAPSLGRREREREKALGGEGRPLAWLATRREKKHPPKKLAKSHSSQPPATLVHESKPLILLHRSSIYLFRRGKTVGNIDRGKGAFKKSTHAESAVHKAVHLLERCRRLLWEHIDRRCARSTLKVLRF